MLKSLTSRIAPRPYRPRKVPGRNLFQRASVAILIAYRPHPEILLIKRAQRAGDPWSGDVAFPGGRRQAEDLHLYQTAIRELQEETGLDATRHAQFRGRLSDLVTRTHSRPAPMFVTPYVFEWHDDGATKLNHEAVDSFWVPLSFFQTPAHRKRMVWKMGPVPVKLPCYFVTPNPERPRHNYRVWGLTLKMIDELSQLMNPRHP